ncbi:hypothetical protein C1646_768969 [Rhizophagus diaphanus]|nr:hypothetical protein C1646_768969 [Rhizophagus diaphanus] [Rhizophagus sp. MUCL 43196]
MDGVPGINQSPIPGYVFPVRGLWYHSHYEMQIADGLFGPIIVEDCDDINRVKNLNDYDMTYDKEDNWNDNIIAVSDWFQNYLS